MFALTHTNQTKSVIFSKVNMVVRFRKDLNIMKEKKMNVNSLITCRNLEARQSFKLRISVLSFNIISLYIV